MAWYWPLDFADWSRKGPLTQNGPIRVPSLEFRVGTQKERELEPLCIDECRELEGGLVFHNVNGKQREPVLRKQERGVCAKKSWDEKQGDMGDKKYYPNFYPLPVPGSRGPVTSLPLSSFSSLICLSSEFSLFLNISQLCLVFKLWNQRHFIQWQWIWGGRIPEGVGWAKAPRSKRPGCLKMRRRSLVLP